MKNNKIVLVINCGSSSVKFAAIDINSENLLISGIAEKINSKGTFIKYKINSDKHNIEQPNASHEDIIDFIVNSILKKESSILDDIIAVGHRVVHGGEFFSDSVIINDTVIEKIEESIGLAPLHNPAHVKGIRSAISVLPNTPQVAVFDTAFHQTLPQVAYLYSLPIELYKDHKIRRYGMHGTSHKYVCKKSAELLNLDFNDSNFISCHLGNGASVCAVKKGVSVDTSMGLTPLEGLTMGTRSGDLDPSIIFHLVDQLGYSLEEVKSTLISKSGLLGISGLTSDCREIEDACSKGHTGSILALDIFCYKLAKYIASYFVPLINVDALIFTGGIGENSDIIRGKVLFNLKCFNYNLDETSNLNCRFGSEGVITAKDSPVALVMPTNEELVIAQDSLSLVSSI